MGILFIREENRELFLRVIQSTKTDYLYRISLIYRRFADIFAISITIRMEILTRSVLWKLTLRDEKGPK